MAVDTSERNFEETIEAALVNAGYNSLPNTAYDRDLCLIPEDVITFVTATQPKEWARLKKQYGAEVQARFLKRLAAEVGKRGTLDVLRKGIKDVGVPVKLVFFRPSSGLNPQSQKRYAANVFTLVRQLKYNPATEQSLDVVLFVNGLPVFTAELKNESKGQDVNHAMRQYKKDRDPAQPLFAFGRCLGHFAVDTTQVYMTTHLRGPQTRFLPFNRGRNGGAGNPPALPGKLATAYLWEQTWGRDSVLNMLQHFIFSVDALDKKGRKTKAQHIIFPRYHQLEAVRGMVQDAREHGPGRQYLIQHSAGSGKSYTIAWLAHQLASLHDEQDQRVFDSIIVVTDRRVLDRQLQQTVRSFEQVRGVVENIDQTSRQLKAALEDGKNIIVTTLQKFPVISEQVEQLKGNRFAVIVDEAHSSQSGESVKHRNAVLAVSSLEEAEQADDVTGQDWEDYVAESQRRRGRLPNVSLFAFTATPKPRTLELFGTRRPDGKYEPFSLYSMRQAIEEGFILDVLQHYTTYHSYWNLLKKIEDDPRYERRKAEYLLKRFVELHDHSIGQKVAIMVEHFREHVAHKIGDQAKAMIVTRSRLHAVRYKLAVDAYLAAQGYPYKALVAFSGSVHDGGKDFTEANMNSIPETQTVETFKGPEYRFMIVANKFQTGFDQPLLYAMYVDKTLGGVQAVQTLSRLNRIHPAKDGTMVLDFANDADAIKQAFDPYYEKTLLSEGTDPNLLYDLQQRIDEFHLFTEAEVDAFARVWFAQNGTQAALYNALQPAIDRYQDIDDEQEQRDFRSALRDYVRLYRFLSQIIPFEDVDLEKLYAYANLLQRRLPNDDEVQLPLEVQQAVDIKSYRIQETHNGAITLERGEADLPPQTEHSGSSPAEDEQEQLSAIITELNKRFGTEFTDEDMLEFVDALQSRLAEDKALANSVLVNNRENARLTFDHRAHDILQDMVEPFFKFYREVNDNKDFAQILFDYLFDHYMTTSVSEGQD